VLDLQKFYHGDDKKFGRELYDILNVKLNVFYDNCNKVRLPLEDIHIGFSIMLKGRVSTYYYSSI
jgi:hypothetical protein